MQKIRFYAPNTLLEDAFFSSALSFVPFLIGFGDPEVV